MRKGGDEMKYYLISKVDGSRVEITHERALEYLKSNYVENICTYEEMLEMENVYPCMTCIIEVRSGNE